jgi:glyoxylase-like metal-dependent hydrolase (beta-lactamase superfamily II)
MIRAVDLPPASQAPPPYQPRSIDAGSWRVTALSDGFLRLDGGSMWGVVPATIWRELTPPAEDNTILLALRPFLAERGRDKVVIEIGVGERWDPKWRDIYRMERTTTLAASLRACGVEPGEVTHVVASHCHWDHIGAAVVERDGELAPLFPNARHFAPRIEIEVAKRPGGARRASYRREDVEPLEHAGVLEAYEGERELLPGLVASVLGGHSDGVAVIVLDDAAIFWSDVVPTAHHAQPPYVMAYDIDVVRSFEQRSKWLARAAERTWVGLFFHDADHAFARVDRDGRRYAVEPVAGEPARAR